MTDTTTIEIPVTLRDELTERKQHEKEAYYTVIQRALGETESDGQEITFEDARLIAERLETRIYPYFEDMTQDLETQTVELDASERAKIAKEVVGELEGRRS